MKDLFSKHAKAYANHRPSYPKALFDLLFERVRGRDRAWDVACGNGQVAHSLASVFDRVDATDISEAQLAEAERSSNVHYQVAPAEGSPFPESAFDLITVAQALHWFDVAAFHREVQRVAKEGASIAEWGYARLQCEDERVDRLIDRFYNGTIAPYWDPERKHVDLEYSDLAFPFSEVEEERLHSEFRWGAERTAAYLRTWSSVQKFIDQEGKDPVDELEDRMKEVIGNGERLFRFPIFFRMGRVQHRDS